MKTSLRAPTRYEAERIEALQKLGCVACAVLGVPNVNHLELHHILDGGIRMGHWFTLFLCRGHHQGDWSELQLEWIGPKQRYAISDGRKRFNAVYGTERSLWETCQKRLNLSLAWPVSKRVPRRIYVADTDLQSLVDHPANPADPMPDAGLAVASGARARRGEPS